MQNVHNFKGFILTNMLGTFLQYLDATLYAFFATTIARAFFPKGNPTTSLIMSLGVFAIAFLVQPLGGLLFGFLGDRFGRRNILTINILMMALGTMSIGLIPKYAVWGIKAPLALILCRIIQGLSVSSEYTGSSIYVLEMVPKHHGLFSGILTASASLGIFFASFLAMQLTRFHGEHHWRSIFVFCGFIFGVLGFYLRKKQPESLAFLKNKAANLLHKKPLFVLLQHHRKAFFTCMGLSMYMGIVYYTILIYSTTYLTRLGMNPQDALTISTLLALTESCSSIFFGWLADQYSLRSILLFSTTMMLLIVVPLFLLLNVHHFWTTLLALEMLVLLVGAFDGPMSAYFVAQFDISLRYTGMTLSYNLGGAVLGGLMPMVMTYGIAKTNCTIFPCFVIAAVSLLASGILLRKR